ncbi:MAG: type II/IV secretion system protein, partial [Melioribacteraceae bacterium]|nr:type II/IV secretion system protein [Melioribacteraceae bacterium]
MLDSQLEVTDKIGYFLLKKGIIDDDILEKALEIKQDDQSKKKRNLAQILVHELKFDHDTIFKEVAVLYAFKELDIQVSELPDQRIEEIKRLLNLKGDEIRDQLLLHKILPYSYDKLRDKIV